MGLKAALFNSAMQHRSDNRGHIIYVVVNISSYGGDSTSLNCMLYLLHCDYNSILIVDILANIYLSVQYECSKEIKSKFGKVSMSIQV